MAQKRFVFDDEKETVQTQQSLSQIDQYENYKHSEEKKIIDKKETISKIPKDSFSPQYSMKETREEPIPTMIHKKTKPQQTKLIEKPKTKQKLLKKKSIAHGFQHLFSFLSVYVLLQVFVLVDMSLISII